MSDPARPVFTLAFRQVDSSCVASPPQRAGVTRDARRSPLASAAACPSSSSRCRGSPRSIPRTRRSSTTSTSSFYPGAKIGVIGANGSGKSSLMRIMAGVDKTFGGEAKPHPGTRIGYFAQEPDMGDAKTVAEAVAEGVAETRAAAHALRGDQQQARRADGRRRHEEAARGAGGAPGQDRRRRRVEPRSPRRARDGRAARPAGRRRDREPLRRREAPRRAVPSAPVAARHAHPRRADQPPRRRVGRVARALPARVHGHGRRGHPRPLLPRQRRRLDPRARSRQGSPVQGKLHGLARAEGRAPRASRRSPSRRGSAS